MKKRPIAVILIAVLIMLSGIFGLVGDVMNFKSIATDHYETVWAVCVHALGIVAGVFMLRGQNWARWLAVAWMAFHVALSWGGPRGELVMHSILLVLFAYGLFRADARPFFAAKSRAA